MYCLADELRLNLGLALSADPQPTCPHPRPGLHRGIFSETQCPTIRTGKVAGPTFFNGAVSSPLSPGFGQ